MQELRKFDLKINAIPNGLEKYMSFTINNKISFIDNFQFLSSSLDSLVINWGRDDFKYLSQEFDNNVLDLAKQKGFYFYVFMSDFEKFTEELRSKVVLWPTEKLLLTKNMNMFLMSGINLKWKQWTIITTCI